MYFCSSSTPRLKAQNPNDKSWWSITTLHLHTVFKVVFAQWVCQSWEYTDRSYRSWRTSPGSPSTSHAYGPRTPTSGHYAAFNLCHTNVSFQLSYSTAPVWLWVLQILADPQTELSPASSLGPTMTGLGLTLAAITGSDPDLKLWIDFPAWPQTCLITRNLPVDLGSWLKPDTISRPALYPHSGAIGWCPGLWVFCPTIFNTQLSSSLPIPLGTASHCCTRFKKLCF